MSSITTFQAILRISSRVDLEARDLLKENGIGKSQKGGKFQDGI